FLDELRLRQILIHLAANADKITDKGFVRLSAEALNQSEESILDVHISVQDTGIGVLKKDMDVIFDSFKQQTGQDSSRYGGTGLGLAICKRLVRLMNGSINAESIEGKGSTFKIIIKDVLSEAKEIQVIKEQIYHEDVKFKNGIALVVDDVDSNRQILKKLLNKMNLDVLEAQNGQEAIVISLECQPDIIFMDIRMPVMDGFEAVRQLKNNQKIYKTPVIGVTASFSGLIPSMIMEKGFNGFLSKPIEADKLLAELLKYMPVAKTDEHKKVSEKREITDEWKALSDKTLSRLPELIRILNSEYMDQWKEFAKRQPIEEVKKFGKDLKDLGREFEINPLVDYGKSLLVDIDNFDVATMQITINNFLLLRSKIEALIEENS
ncbi:MAG: response regulator, partial [Desulfobulbaceae bacterium]|nr:response regulator [Desulfobulbaceae bacterium]